MEVVVQTLSPEGGALLDRVEAELGLEPVKLLGGGRRYESDVDGMCELLAGALEVEATDWRQHVTLLVNEE